MTARIVVNADALGLSHSRNAGIFEAVAGGIVSSVSLLGNAPEAAFDDAVSWLRSLGREVGISIGLHANLVSGAPVAAGHATLVGADGRLLGPEALRARARAGELDAGEVARELDAQVARLRAAGVEPSHLSGEAHAHVIGELATAHAKACIRGSIDWIRVPRAHAGGAGDGGGGGDEDVSAAAAVFEGAGLRTADRFCDLSRREPLEPDFIAAALRAAAAAGEGLTELVCLPGYRDPNGTAACTAAREAEVRALTAPAIRDLLEELGLRLVRFGPHRV